MSLWIIDGNNVMGSRPDGWWRDRTGAMGRIVRLVNGMRAETGDEFVVVFDGHVRGEVTGAAEEGVSVRFADRPEDEPADAAIVDLVRGADDTSELTVVTSDKGLIERIEGAGVSVVGGGEFRGRLEGAP